jgi:hypothetical protein
MVVFNHAFNNGEVDFNTLDELVQFSNSKAEQTACPERHNRRIADAFARRT